MATYQINQITLPNGDVCELESINDITVTLNGTVASAPSFYAPTSTGTANYFLKSAGSGAPSWAQPIKYGTSLPSSGDFTGQVFILIE